MVTSSSPDPTPTRQRLLQRLAEIPTKQTNIAPIAQTCVNDFQQHPSGPSRSACASSDEPGAVVPHAGICEGGAEQSASLPQSQKQMKFKILLVLLFLPFFCEGKIINVYFAGGQSNATSTWATAAKNTILIDDPEAVFVWVQHGGTPLREWYTSYSYSGKVGRQRYYLNDLYDPDPLAKGKLEVEFDSIRAQGHTPVLSGLLWFQGETDQYVPQSYSNKGYYNDFIGFLDVIKADFFSFHLSVSLAIVYEGSGGPAGSNLQAIRDQQAALGLDLGVFAYETIGLLRSDGVHLTASSAQLAGIEMAAGLPRPEPPKLSLNFNSSVAQLNFFNMRAAQEYRIMRSFDLGAWEEVHRFTPTASNGSWSDALAPDAGRFYRLEWNE